MPILILQEVARQNIHLHISGILSKSNDSFDICRFQQAFHTLHFLVGHGVNFGSQFELALFFDQFGQPQEDLLTGGLHIRVVRHWGDQLVHLVFFQCHVVLLSNGQGLVQLAKTNHYFNSFFVLSILHQERDRGFQNLRVVTISDSTGHILNQVTQVVGKRQIHGSPLIATPGVQLHTLVKLALLFKVLG